MIIIVMGVEGSGKNSVGATLSDELGCHFYDGADFHSASNVEKIQQGTPLSLEDQQQWLTSIRSLIENHLEQERSAVIACTGLKAAARQQLSQGDDRIYFVFLRGTYETLWDRLTRRKNHSLKAEMLQSQLDGVAELGQIDLIIDIEEATTDEIVDVIVSYVNGTV